MLLCLAFYHQLHCRNYVKNGVVMDVRARFDLISTDLEYHPNCEVWYKIKMKLIYTNRPWVTLIEYD